MPPGRGDRIADFVLPSGEGTPTRFYGVAGGKPSVLLSGNNASEATTLAAALDGIPVFAILPEAAPGSATLSTFVDAEGTLRAKLGIAPLVLDANLRVLDAADSANAAASVRAILSRLPRIEATAVVTQAPVLLVPDVLEPDACAFLLKVFEAKGSVESGVEELYSGSRADVLRPDAKRRRDHVVEDEELMRLLTSTLGRRIFPEIQRAFAYRATRLEGFKIAAYPEGGFFRAHRDNLSPATAHRRFSVTLNLDDGYDGGHLRFPEYGPHLYRPPAGGALVFSASLLHEVLPVTRGTRHVLITFVFGDEVKRGGS